MAKSLKNQSTDLNFQTLPSEIVSSGINTDQSLQLSTFNTKSAVLRSRPLTAISLKPKSSRFSQDQAKIIMYLVFSQNFILEKPCLGA